MVGVRYLFLLIRYRYIGRIGSFVLDLFNNSNICVKSVSMILFRYMTRRFFRLFISVFRIVANFASGRHVNVSYGVFSISTSSSLGPTKRNHLVLAQGFRSTSTFFRLLMRLYLLICFFFRRSGVDNFQGKERMVNGFFNAFFGRTTIFSRSRSTINGGERYLY